MRTLLIGFLTIASVTGVPPSIGAAAGDPVTGPRVEAIDYVSNGFFVGGHGNLIGQEGHMTIPKESAPVVFDPAPGDRFVRLEIDDASGRPAVVVVHQDAPGAHVHDLEFCAPAQFLSLRSSAPMEIRLFTGVCHNHKYGTATTGTITATFSR